jgi:hypothetical protein
LGTPESRRDLSVSFERLGDIARARGQLAAAERWFEQARALREPLAQELGTPESRRDLSVTLCKLAVTAAVGQDADRAYSLAEAAAVIRRALDAELQTAQSCQDLIESLTPLSVLAQALERPDAQALAAELAAAAFGPRRPDETPTMVVNRAKALAATAYSQAGTDPAGAAAALAEARGLLGAVESLCTPMEAVATDCVIGIVEVELVGKDDGREALARLDALERRLMERLGDQWETGGTLFRDQLGLLRGQLEGQGGGGPQVG